MHFLENIQHIDDFLILAFNAAHTPWMDRMAWLLSETMVWLPALFVLLYILIKNKGGETVLIVLVAILLIVFVDQISSSLIKPMVARLRPTRNMELIPYLELVNGYRGGRYGFLSSHAANVFAFAAYTSLLFRHKPYTILIMVWAFLVSLSRIYLSVHYPSDVVAGILLGLVSGWLFYGLLGLLMGPGRVFSKPTYAVNGNTSTRYCGRDVNLLLITLGIILVTLAIASLKLV